jgi:hypothetical protein
MVHTAGIHGPAASAANESKVIQVLLEILNHYPWGHLLGHSATDGGPEVLLTFPTSPWHLGNVASLPVTPWLQLRPYP